ncbi:MAG: TonB-dependent receptor [Gammaproteobacteria bacterium]|nr:TonB-dependent receptor [Gammaproteobacteria bacterium]
MKRSIQLALATMAGVTTLPALAQSLVIEEIIVTAERREVSIQDVGIAVSALDQAAIERLNARDIRDLEGLVPNFNMGESAIGPGLSIVSMRGVSSQDPEKSFDPAVGVFIDGIYLGTSAYNVLNTFDLERIEVLRGPQGTLFGRNTTGGVINAVRSRPTGEWGLKTSLIAGNKGRLDFKGVANIPVIEDQLGLKISGYRETDDGFWSNPNGGPTGEKDRWSTSIALLWTPSDALDLLLTYDHADDSSELAAVVPRGVSAPSQLPVRIIETDPPVAPATIFAGFGPDPLCGLIGSACHASSTSQAQSLGPHEQSSELDALTLNATWRPSDRYEVTGIFGWRDSSEDVLIDFDGTEFTVFDVRRIQNYEQKSAEIRIASSFDGPVDFVAGAYWFESEYDLRQAIKLDLANAGAPVPFGLLYVNGNGNEDRHKARTTALFAHIDYSITDDLRLTIAGRGTWDRRRVAKEFYASNFGPMDPYQVTDGVPTGRPLTDAGAASDSWFEFTPKVALNWSVTDSVLLYGSYTRGYNSGGFSARAGTVEAVTTPFDPEIIDAFEVGVKTDMLDRRLRLNAAIFLNKYKDKQEESIAPAPPPTFTSTTVRNVSEARIAGIEVELSALITESFRIDGSLGLLEAKYTDYEAFLGAGQFISDPPQPAGTLIRADFSTLDMRRTPEVTASLVPAFSRQIGQGNLDLFAIFRYVASYQTDFFNDPRGRIPSQLKVDATASYTWGGNLGDRYMVKLFGRNLTDKQTFSSFTNSVVDFSGLQPPRTWGVELQVQL